MEEQEGRPHRFRWRLAAILISVLLVVSTVAVAALYILVSCLGCGIGAGHTYQASFSNERQGGNWTFPWYPALLNLTLTISKNPKDSGLGPLLAKELSLFIEIRGGSSAPGPSPASCPLNGPFSHVGCTLNGTGEIGMGWFALLTNSSGSVVDESMGGSWVNPDLQLAPEETLTIASNFNLYHSGLNLTASGWAYGATKL